MKLDEAIELIKEEEVIEILKNLIRVPGHVNYDMQEKEISNLTAEILKCENINTELQEVE